MQANEADSLWRQLQVQEIEVVAAHWKKDVIQPQVLKGEELRQLQAYNVADALRYFSGLQLKDYGGVGGIKTINVRSMGSQHTGVYYNGIQLGNAQNGQVDLGRFSLDNMEQLALYTGQKSDIFQSAREFGSAGNVYLTTRKPYFREGEKVHARLRMRGGSFALVNPAAGVDVRLTDKLSMTLDGEFTYSSGRYPFRYYRVLPDGSPAYDTTAVRQNGDIRAVRAEMGLHHYYSTTGFWRLHGYNYWSERGIPGAIVANNWYNGERMEDRNTFVQGEWQDEFFRRWSIRVQAKYANDYTHYRNLDERTLPSNQAYLQQEAYLSVAQKVTLTRWWDLSMAYDLQYNSLAKRNLLLESLAPESTTEEHFARWSHWLSAATAMNIYDYLRLQASVLMTQVGKAKARVTPGVYLAFRPYPKVDLSLNAYYKQSYRYPTFNDLYYTDLGNANLRPELARQHSVDVQYRWQGKVLKTLDMAVSYYYNKVSDKIIAYPKGQQFRWTMLNLGLVSIHGADARADIQVALPGDVTLRTRLNYTWQRALDITSATDSYYRHQIPYIPLHSGSAVGSLDWDANGLRKGAGRYGLSYSFVYVGERYGQQENTIFNYVQPWYTHDLGVYGEWMVHHHALRLCIEINNLLGQDYEVIQNYPMPKQSVRCTASVRY